MSVVVQFLQELKGQSVHIELKNGSVVSGKIENVDNNMNTHMSNVKTVVKGRNPVTEPYVTVRGGMIRYFKLESEYRKALETAEKKEEKKVHRQ